MNLYKMLISYLTPHSVGVNVLATSPQEAEHRLKTTIDFDNAPAEIQLKLDSCELIQENIEHIDETSLIEDYKKLDTRVIN